METQPISSQEPLQSTEPVIPPVSQPVVDPVKQVVLKKSPLIPILIILLILALAVAIYFFLQSRMIISTPITSEGSTPAPTANIDLTADWQTYTNLRYHYSFKYPSDWKISFEDTYQYSNVTISSPSDKSINVVQFTGNPEADKPNFTKNFVLDENNSLMAIFTHCPSGPGSDCAGAQTIEDIELFKQILSTFQFTNAQTSSEEDEVRAFITKFADSYSRGDWDTLQSMLTQAMQQDMETNKSSLGTGYNFDHYQITNLQKNSNSSYTATIQFELDGQPYTNAQGNPQIMVVNENGEWKSKTWYLYE
ncbi:MAG: PsbP-related protein [bacterium]